MATDEDPNIKELFIQLHQRKPYQMTPAETEQEWMMDMTKRDPENKYPYEPETAKHLEDQVRDLGSSWFRETTPATREFLKKVPDDMDIYKPHEPFFMQGMDKEQQEQFLKNPVNRMIFIRKKPLTS
jgi:hypothetical protein